MTKSSADSGLLAAARRADRWRRVQATRQRLARLAPMAALVSVGGAGIAFVVRGPWWVGPAMLTALGLAAGITLWRARRERPVSDDAARRLDAAAGLAGLLRSAHWFASQPSPDVHATEQRAWIAYHVEQAVVAAERVDWRTLYRPAPARAAWLVTAGIGVVTMVLAVWRMPAVERLQASSGSPSAAPTAVEEAAEAIPLALVPQLIQGVRAVRAGRPLTAEELAAIGQALELAGSDPSAEKALERLLAETRDGDGLPAWATDLDLSGDGRGDEDEYSGRGDLSRDGLEWAYQEAAAKAADARERSGEPGEAASVETPEAEGTGETELDSGSGESSAGSPALAEARAEASSFSSLLFGRQYSKDGAGRAAASAKRVALATALKNEVVHARVDLGAVGEERSATRRTTNQNRGAGATIVSAGRTAYDRARASEPPVVPEARRPLVHDYFLRPAEPAASPSPARTP